MKKIMHNIWLGLLLFMGSGCSNWLEVNTSDKVAEHELYSSLNGFKASLNGIYIEMASDGLYGMKMTTGVIDMLANYYYTPPMYSIYLNYDYTDEESMLCFDELWQKFYLLIINVNTLLEHCENTSVLPERYQNMIEGEALALRAFLHFDILRLWGPIYSESTKNEKVMPYNTTSGQDVKPYLTVEEVVYDHIIPDLKTAMDLLKQVDPICADGSESDTDDSFFSNRQYRMNYYAVYALLARVYQWVGERELAYNAGKQIIQECQIDHSLFPFVSKEDASDAAEPDRLFSSEVLFAVYDDSREAMFNSLLSPNLASYMRVYTADVRVRAMFDDDADYRYLAWAYQQVGTDIKYYNRKLESVNVVPLDYMLPLIRISELYYIIAASTDDMSEAEYYLNEVRDARSCRSLSIATEADLDAALLNEYWREFMSEGQLFFYYKHNSITTIPTPTTVYNRTMALEDYVIPQVRSEIERRTDN